MEKIEKLRELLKKEDIDLALITDTDSINYFIGHMFHVGERFIGLLVGQNTLKLYLNKLFVGIPFAGEIIWYHDSDDIVADVAKEFENKKVAIDKNCVSKFTLELIEKCPSAKYSIGYVIDKVRAIKDSVEQQKMIEASLKNDQVMAKVAELIQLGKTEQQLADEIQQEFMNVFHGLDNLFIIVAYGDHAADPHAMLSDRALKEGENIVVDMGAAYQGYCSDMTRTFFVNSNPEQEVYDTVVKANEAAEAMVKPGVRFCDIDKAARDVIEKAGYGPYFTHRLGHGIGLNVHEPFDVSGSDELIVQPGMCFSIEPGIYIPGRVGVRIEDLVCVTEDGCKVLNHYPKHAELLKR